MKQTRFIVTLSLALLLTLLLANSIASAQPLDTVPAQPGRGPLPAPQADSVLPPLTYAWVITANVPVYASPGDAHPFATWGQAFYMSA